MMSHSLKSIIRAAQRRRTHWNAALLLGLGAAFLPAAAAGWKSPPAALAGTANDAAHGYLTNSNWDGNSPELTFSPALTGATSLYFSSSFSTGGTWNFGYTGNFPLTLQGGGLVAADGVIPVAAAAQTVTLGGNVTVNIGGTNNQTLTLGGSGTSELALDLNNAARNFSVIGEDQLILVNSLKQATAGFTKLGNGRLTLRGNDADVDGSILVNAGILQLESANALGGGALDSNKDATIILSAGTSLSLENNVDTNFDYPVTLNGNASISAFSNPRGIDVTHSLGAVAMNASQLSVHGKVNLGALSLNPGLFTPVTFNTGKAGTELNLSSIVAGGFANRTINNAGQGTLLIANAGTNFIGATTVNSSGGSLTLGNINALGGGANVYNLSGSAGLTVTANSPANAGSIFNVAAGTMFGGSTVFLNSLVVGAGQNVPAFPTDAGLTQLTSGAADAWAAANGLAATPNFYLGVNGNSFAGIQSLGTGTHWKGLSNDGHEAAWIAGDITLNGSVSFRGMNSANLILGNGSNPTNLNLLAVAPTNVSIIGNVVLDTGGAAGASNFENVTFVVDDSLRLQRNFSLGGVAATLPAKVIVENTGRLSVEGDLPSAINGDVEVRAGGLFTANGAGGLQGTGTIIVRAEGLLSIRDNAGAIAGTQPLVFDPGGIVQINVDNPTDLDAKIGDEAVFELAGGNRMLPNITLNSAPGSNSSGMLTNDGSTLIVNNSSPNTITIGPNGGILAASTGSSLSLTATNISGPGNKLTIGTIASIHNDFKAGVVQITGGLGQGINVGSVDIVRGTLNGLSGGIEFNVGGGTGPIAVFSGATLTSGTGTLTNGALNVQAGATARFQGSLSNAAAVASLEGAGSVVVGNTTTNSAVALTVGGNNLSTLFSGVISNANTAGNRRGALVKTGSGIMTLTGANSYSGSTSVQGGTLAVSQGGSLLNTSNVTIAAGSNFQLDGNTPALTNSTAITTVAPTSLLNITSPGQVAGHVSGPVDGTHPFGAMTGKTTIAAAGNLQVNGLRQNKLTLAAGTPALPKKLTLAPQGGSAGLIVLNNTLANAGAGTPGLVMGADSLIDIHDNDIVLYYTGEPVDPNPTATIQGYIDNFYAAATGVPVIASQGIIDSGGQTVFVAIDNGVTGFGDGAVGGTFYDLTLGDSGAGSGFNQVIVRYTWGGDYDLNGVVDALDYAVVDANLGQTVSAGGVAGWQRGDGDFDGMITPLDYSPIDANLGKGGPLGGGLLNGNGGSTINAIPEPSAWALVIMVAAGLAALGLRRNRTPRIANLRRPFQPL